VTTPDPFLFVAFGGTGDLTQRKLLPALRSLMEEGQIDARSPVLAVATQRLTDEQYRAWARTEAGAGSSKGRWADRLFYQTIGDSGAEDFRAVAARIAALEKQHDLPGCRVFYLALPPAIFPAVVSRLGEAGLNRSRCWTRIVVEKPFGSDLESAKVLNNHLHGYFEEPQIYRIDHYLGKETVQNLLVFRFANAMFESVWNRDRVDSVSITVAEELGVEHRGRYYDKAGALRDVVQNHLTQLLTIAAMELPAAFDSRAIRYEKAKVLKAISPIRPEDVAYGQYARGHLGGAEVPGYREELWVAPDSQTDTFVALKLNIANWRWHGVPFYLHTGKRLPRRVSQMAVTFRRPPLEIFRPSCSGAIHPNVLLITIQPDEGFDLQFEVKEPGQPIRLRTQSLRFRYAETFAPLADAYQALLLDVVRGDQTLFVSDEWAEASWQLYTPLLGERPPVRLYPAGTWGPAGLEHLSWPPKSLIETDADSLSPGGSTVQGGQPPPDRASAPLAHQNE
jgi:glucose-6-phosphate 1-dehydrogenase